MCEGRCELRCYQVYDRPSPLNPAPNLEHGRSAGHVVGGCPDSRPHHDVGSARFIFDREEDHALGRCRPLPHEHDSSHTDAVSLRACRGCSDREHTGSRELFPLEGQRMRGERESAGAIVGDHLLLPGHRGQPQIVVEVIVGKTLQQRSMLWAFEAAHRLPDRAAPGEAERGQRSGAGQMEQGVAVEPGPVG